MTASLLSLESIGVTSPSLPPSPSLPYVHESQEQSSTLIVMIGVPFPPPPSFPPLLARELGEIIIITGENMHPLYLLPLRARELGTHLITGAHIGSHLRYNLVVMLEKLRHVIRNLGYLLCLCNSPIYNQTTSARKLLCNADVNL